MHMMFFDIVATDGQKSAKTDMEGEVFDLDAFGLELFDKFFSHIEAGGWGGGRTEFFGPDGLVAFDVIFVGVAVKIGRKRNIAVIGDNFSEAAIGGNGGGTVAKNFFDSNDVVRLAIVSDVFYGKLIADMKFAAIHDVINFAIVFLKYDEFAWTSVW